MHVLGSYLLLFWSWCNLLRVNVESRLFWHITLFFANDMMVFCGAAVGVCPGEFTFLKKIILSRIPLVDVLTGYLEFSIPKQK